VETGRLLDRGLSDVLDKMHPFLKQFNNNYRSIYHMESILFFMMNRVHGYL